MKARATLVLVLVLSLALVPVLASVPVHAQSGYTEKLTVYTAGEDAFWCITMGGLATTPSSITTVESTTGLTSFSLIAMSSSGLTSDLQVFGANGYNLLHLPSTPSEGLFLTVNASASTADAAVVSDFDSLFVTNFTQVSSSGDSVTYYAPVDFVNTALLVLYPLVPTSLGGFASFVSESTLESVPTPFVELTGSYNGTGFSNAISIGGAATDVISSTGALNLSELIGSTNATISTASSSTSSEVVIHSLDGLISSSDAATVTNHVGNFSSSYYLSVAPSAQVKANVTIETQHPVALAYRELDHGEVTDGDLLGVDILVFNTAESGTIYNVTLDDNWWQQYPSVFQLSSGSSSSILIPSIAAGQNQTLSYTLNVTSSSAAQITIPATSLSYTYKLSNGTYTGYARLGQQVLEVNQVDPSLSAVAKTDVSSGSALGTSGNYTITLTNLGTSAAQDVTVAGKSVGTIVQNGGTTTIDVPITYLNLAETNLSSSFLVTYTNTAQQSFNVTTNNVQLIYSHTSMVIPFIELTTNDTVTESAIAAKTMNVTYTFSNGGSGKPSSINATNTFPSGVTCTDASLVGTCSGNTYSVSITSLPSSGENNLTLTFNTNNYIVPPTSIVASYEGMELYTYGGGYVIPAGLVITKSFSPNTGFPGSGSVVTLGIKNVGTSPVYNLTLNSGFDNFDLASNSSETTYRTYAQISAGASENFTYGVTLSAAEYGNVSGTTASADFSFAGAAQGISEGSGSMIVYAAPTATVTTSPTSPEQNHDFTLTVTISNSAAVGVSDVVYTLKLPPGVSVVSGGTLSNHVLTLDIASLAANADQNFSLTLKASSGLTIDTSNANAHLTFQYLGAALAGTPIANSIIVRIDETTTYTLPIGVAVVAGLVAVIFVRRRAGPVAKP